MSWLLELLQAELKEHTTLSATLSVRVVVDREAAQRSNDEAQARAEAGTDVVLQSLEAEAKAESATFVIVNTPAALAAVARVAGMAGVSVTLSVGA